MITADMEKLYPSAKKLVRDSVASRVFKKDASLYDFSDEAVECAENFMGWTDLATNPPFDIDKIVEFADSIARDGIDTMVILGQGGSTQAPMTITKYNKVDKNRISCRVMDNDSPVRMRELFAHCSLENTLFIFSSKSGGTIEPRMLFAAIKDHYKEEARLKGLNFNDHLVAITDPGTELHSLAEQENWRQVFLGVPQVGGRFSALSVFGLVPAALAGIDMKCFMEHARKAEASCSEDAIDNPAINLAAFLYDNYLRGRNKITFLSPKRGRVLGLWIEQLVAESLGKNGQGILPNIEVDSMLLTRDRGDRSVVMYETKTDLWDDSRNFEMSLSYINPSIPRQSYKISVVEELAEHFIMWEYAVAMCGYLMQVCPFDQPDVASTKALVKEILNEGLPEPNYVEQFTQDVDMGVVEVRYSENLGPSSTLQETLMNLLTSIRLGDYFATNAFLPFTGEGRREALENVRHRISDDYGVVSCLEVGPRYLHSTGQLQKGGPNIGVFLLLSAGELKDIQLPEGSDAESLGTLAKAQAVGDFMALAEKGRRVVHLHLPDNAGVTLRMLSDVIACASRKVRPTQGTNAAEGKCD